MDGAGPGFYTCWLMRPLRSNLRTFCSTSAIAPESMPILLLGHGNARCCGVLAMTASWEAQVNPAVALMGIYILVTAALQAAAFVVSRIVNALAPSASLMVFLVLFLAMFWIGWPIAVLITEA